MPSVLHDSHTKLTQTPQAKISMETNIHNQEDLSQILFKMGDWLVDPRALKIENGHEVRSVRAKTMEVLLLLAERSGNVVMREEIIDRVWNGNTYVAAKGVTNTIWNLRQILDDTADTPRYIETIAKKGYRLLTPIQALELSPPLISQFSDQTEPNESSHETATPEAPARTSPAFNKQLIGFSIIAFMAIVLTYFVVHKNNSHSISNPTLSSAHMSVKSLFATPEEESLLAVSPDQQHYAFVTYRGLGAINNLYLRAFENEAPASLLLQTKQRITSLEYHPGGESITLARFDENLGCVIESLELKTREVHQLQTCAINSIGRFSWSSDGTRLAFVTNMESGNIALVEYNAVTKVTKTIKIIQAGLNLMVVSYDKSDDAILAIQRTNVGNSSLVSISPKGDSKIVWQAGNRFLYPVGEWLSNTELLLSMVPDGMSPQFMVVNTNTGDVTPTGMRGYSPHLLSNGRFVFIRINMQLDIAAYSIPEKRMLEKPLVRRPNLSVMPSFGVGNAFSFLSLDGEDWAIFAHQADGSTKKLSLPATDVGEPAISRDGQLLAVIGNCVNPSQQSLCMLDLGTNQLRTAAITEGFLSRPFWLPGNKALIIPIKDRELNQTKLARFHLHDNTVTWLNAIPISESVRFSDDGQRVYWTQAHQTGIYTRDIAGGEITSLAPDFPANSPLWAVHQQKVYYLVKDASLHWNLQIANIDGDETWVADIGKIALSQLGGIAINDDESLLLLPYLSLAETDIAIAEPKQPH